jgi:hypothetical protein
MKSIINTLIIGVSCCIFLASAQEKPYFREVRIINFGELLGLVGSCELDHETNEVSDGGGSLCPFTGTRYGEAGKYEVVADPNTNIKLKISIRASINGDGINFIPSGKYEVIGEPDVDIIVNQNQTIFTGSTGVITILVGGTLMATSTQNYNDTYEIEFENGITFDEVL